MYGLAEHFRSETGDRNRDVSRAKAAASRAFWAAGDAHYAAADAYEIAAACNSGDEPQADEVDFAKEGGHFALAATRAAIRAGKASHGVHPVIGVATEIDAEDAAEEAARLVREVENVAERCLNGS
jgi:hypothetical protein